MNVHTPERQADETQQQYRERQACSRSIARRARCGLPLLFGGDWPLRTRKNPNKKNRRAAIKAIGRRQLLKLSKAARRSAA